MASSYDVIRKMKTILLDKETLINLAVPVILPIIVLILAVSPTVMNWWTTS